MCAAWDSYVPRGDEIGGNSCPGLVYLHAWLWGYLCVVTMQSSRYMAPGPHVFTAQGTCAWAVTCCHSLPVLHVASYRGQIPSAASSSHGHRTSLSVQLMALYCWQSMSLTLWSSHNNHILKTAATTLPRDQITWPETPTHLWLDHILIENMTHKWQLYSSSIFLLWALYMQCN